MEWLQVTMRLYRKCFARGAELALRNWPVFATVFAYGLILFVGTQLAFRLLGFLGGFAVVLLQAACASSFLYLVENIVRTSRVTLADFRNGFGVYLWDVIGVLFFRWIIAAFLFPLLAQTPQGPLLITFVSIVLFVFFNAVPELIYLGHFNLPQLLQESYGFISENWMEWFPANLVLAFIFVLLYAIPSAGVLLVPKIALVALAVYFWMVVRGILFLELSGTTHRSRVFRYRMGDD